MVFIGIVKAKSLWFILNLFLLPLNYSQSYFLIIIFSSNLLLFSYASSLSLIEWVNEYLFIDVFIPPATHSVILLWLNNYF